MNHLLYFQRIWAIILLFFHVVLRSKMFATFFQAEVEKAGLLRMYTVSFTRKKYRFSFSCYAHCYLICAENVVTKYGNKKLREHNVTAMGSRYGLRLGRGCD